MCRQLPLVAASPAGAMLPRPGRSLSITSPLTRPRRSAQRRHLDRPHFTSSSSTSSSSRPLSLSSRSSFLPSRSSSSSSSSRSSSASSVRFSSSSSSSTSSSSSSWSETSHHPPPVWPSCSNPTPYEIFNIHPRAPYCKSRYYQLVKLYHPDLSSSSANTSTTTTNSNSNTTTTPSSPLPHSTRLDRYRLVVHANTILSCPDKRHLYDSLGLGWTDSPTSTLSSSPSDTLSRQAYRAWRFSSASPAPNATWEDWERWHALRRRGRAPGQPVYMSHAAFAGVVLVLVAVGGVAQALRLEGHNLTVEDRRRERHEAISTSLRKRYGGVAGTRRDEKIENFLRERDNLRWEYRPGIYEGDDDDGHDG